MAHCSLERSTCNPQFVVDGIILEPRESAAHAAWRVGGKQHCMGSFGCRLHVNTAWSYHRRNGATHGGPQRRQRRAFTTRRRWQILEDFTRSLRDRCRPSRLLGAVTRWSLTRIHWLDLLTTIKKASSREQWVPVHGISSRFLRGAHWRLSQPRLNPIKPVCERR